MVWPTFCGESYKARSSTLAADTAINVYLETRQSETAPKPATWYGTPGLTLQATAATVGSRGSFSQDGRAWTVIGDVFYELAMDSVGAVSLTTIGTVADDGFPVSFISNGKGGDQLGFVSGGVFYVFELDTNTLLPPVSLPFTDPVMACFLDGYGLILQRDSPIVWFSALEDFTSFDALDFFARSSTSDNFIGIGATRDRIWGLGSATTTLFYDSGDADTPFVPYPGSTTQVGLATPWLMAVDGDVVTWVGTRGQGALQVFQATDPAPTVISTPPIEAFLAACTTVDDGELLAYTQDGHNFSLLTCPSSPADIQTYGWDLREGVWHARAGRDSVQGVYTRWRAKGCISWQDRIFVGDFENGNLYTLELDTYADNGEILKRERTAPYIGDENQWLFLDQIELGVEPGVGLSEGQGADPTVNLELSRDGAHTFVDAGPARIGAMGDYGCRAIWRKLGRARMDRLVLRVTQTDAVKTAWVGAWLRMTPGTGNL